MHALALAAGSILVYCVVITVVLRSGRIRRRAFAMTAIFGLSLPFFIGASSRVFASEADAAAEVAFALLLYTAAFFGGVLQIYNLADRGLSLRMLIDVGHAPGGCLTAHELTKAYSAGRGIEWMYQKRLNDLIERGLVVQHAGAATLTRRGSLAARFFSGVRKLLNIESAV